MPASPIVISAEGDATALVETVAREADPAKGVLLHAAGAETAGRLQHALQARGFRVETAVLYEAVPVAKLPAEAEGPLRKDAVDGVFLFSPRSAKILRRLSAMPAWRRTAPSWSRSASAPPPPKR